MCCVKWKQTVNKTTKSTTTTITTPSKTFQMLLFIFAYNQEKEWI